MAGALGRDPHRVQRCDATYGRWTQSGPGATGDSPGIAGEKCGGTRTSAKTRAEISHRGSRRVGFRNGRLGKLEAWLGAADRLCSPQRSQWRMKEMTNESGEGSRRTALITGASAGIGA